MFQIKITIRDAAYRINRSSHCCSNCCVYLLQVRVIQFLAQKRYFLCWAHCANWEFNSFCDWKIVRRQVFLTSIVRNIFA